MSSKGIVSGGLDLTRVKGLLFDVDGTLSNTDDHLVHRISNLLSPVSWMFRDRNPDRFARWVVMAIETPANFFYSLADRLGMDEPLSNLYNRFSRKRRSRQTKQERFWIIPGTREMLASFKGHFQMAVVSARDAETTAHFLEYFDLLPYFDTVVTAHTTKYTKPFPDPVRHAAQALGLEAEDCLMIGDTIVDVSAGKAAGAQTVAVLCGFGTERELARAGAYLILRETPDLVGILINQNRD